MCLVNCATKTTSAFFDKTSCCFPPALRKVITVISSVVLGLIALASVIGFVLLATGIVQLPDTLFELNQLTYVGIGLIIGMVSLVLSSACWNSRHTKKIDKPTIYSAF